MVEVFPILGESSAAIEPRNGAFDNPAFVQNHKSADLIGTFDDCNVEMRENFCERFRIAVLGIPRRRTASSKRGTSRTGSL